MVSLSLICVILSHERSELFKEITSQTPLDVRTSKTPPAMSQGQGGTGALESPVMETMACPDGVDTLPSWSTTSHGRAVSPSLPDSAQSTTKPTESAKTGDTNAVVSLPSVSRYPRVINTEEAASGVYSSAIQADAYTDLDTETVAASDSSQSVPWSREPRIQMDLGNFVPPGEPQIR